MNALVKIKKQLISNLDARKVTHYCKNLQSLEENTLGLPFNERENIRIEYYSLLPNELIKNIGISNKINSKTAGLIAFYKNEPCGCIFFNLSGKGSLLEPFDFSYEFGRRRAYGRALFVKQEFRSRGISKLLYLKSFEELKNNVFHPLFTGIINGDTGFLTKDVLTSLFYFYFKVSQDKGIKNVDLGLSRAFLNDGVLRYKLKWNTRIEFDKKRSNVFAFKVRRYTNNVKTFLLHNPFITLENGALIANVFCNSKMEINKEELNKKYKLSGISDLRITVLNENEAKIEEPDKEYNLLSIIP